MAVYVARADLRVRIDADIAFRSFLLIDPRAVPQLGSLPGVVEVSEENGFWGETGSWRRLVLSDGAALTEQLVRVDPGGAFVVKVDDLPRPLSRVAEFSVSEWRFETRGNHTLISWIATLQARPRRGLALRSAVRTRIAPAMAIALPQIARAVGVAA